jgi:hypothetical protein
MSEHARIPPALVHRIWAGGRERQDQDRQDHHSTEVAETPPGGRPPKVGHPGTTACVDQNEITPSTMSPLNLPPFRMSFDGKSL